MPSRIAESILKKELTPEGKARLPGWNTKSQHYSSLGAFPFLSIETDGSPFPQLVEANLEAFVLQARRLHAQMVTIENERERKRLWNHLPVTLYELVTGNGFLRKKIKTKPEYSK
jgi:hypothetical protein